MTERRTIIISNRLPVKAEQHEGELVYQNSEGGLATGLSSISNSGDCLWIGWPGITTEDLEVQQRIQCDLRGKNLVPVMLSEKEINEFYEGFSNETLWPLFHYFPTYASYNTDHWNTYVAVNRKFADAIIAVASESDTIWIHDYHLLLVPAMIRAEIPDASIGFFQHIPFPSYEVFRLLPWRAQVMEGLLGADLIGFHTEDDVRHFRESADKIMQEAYKIDCSRDHLITFEDRNITTGAFPMGIDYAKFNKLAINHRTQNNSYKLDQLIGEKKLIISIDRLDYSKGIIHRLKAYEQFLEQYPEFYEKVIFFQLIVPSRDSVKQYASLREEVNRLVSDINSKYGSIAWQPICYFYRSMPVEMLSALYASADVAMVTPLRDGMNLVSKEYIASKVHTPGVLILSEMAGAAKELSEALLVNPNDQQQVVQAIHKSLVMPVREQLKRLKMMQRVIAESDVFRWVDNFMGKLRELKLLRNPFNSTIFNKEVEKQKEAMKLIKHKPFDTFSDPSTLAVP